MTTKSPKEMTKEELRKHFVCLECGYFALISTLNMTGPKHDPDSEYYCPECVEPDGLTNATNVTWCDEDDCDSVVEPGGMNCKVHGSERYEREYWESVDVELAEDEGLRDYEEEEPFGIHENYPFS